MLLKFLSSVLWCHDTVQGGCQHFEGPMFLWNVANYSQSDTLSHLKMKFYWMKNVLIFQDYHWWWRSFIVSGGSAVYVFAYSVFYFVTKLEITEFIPTLLYFGYTGIMVLTFWLLTGTIGFFAAYAFVRKIYAAVKIDWTLQTCTDIVSGFYLPLNVSTLLYILQVEEVVTKWKLLCKCEGNSMRLNILQHV